MVPTAELQQELINAGYKNVEVVSRGVDTELFHPRKRSTDLRRQWGATEGTPVVMLVSRMAAEKNLHVVILAFEQMLVTVTGDVGGRPGMRTGEDLAAHYASGDLFSTPA